MANTAIVAAPGGPGWGDEAEYIHAALVDAEKEVISTTAAIADAEIELTALEACYNVNTRDAAMSRRTYRKLYISTRKAIHRRVNEIGKMRDHAKRRVEMFNNPSMWV